MPYISVKHAFKKSSVQNKTFWLQVIEPLVKSGSDTFSDVDVFFMFFSYDFSGLNWKKL